MGSIKVGVRGRALWVAVFAILLAVSSAIPVLAESPPAETMPVTADGQVVNGSPSAEQVAEGLREAETQEAEEEAERDTPTAIEERKESVEAFADISPGEAVALVQAQFGEQLALIDQDPARMLSEASIDEVLTPTAARVTADGETMLLDGTMPVRTPTEGGDLKKVDLELVSNGEGFRQRNPLAEVELADSASDGVTVGDEGLTVEPVLTEGESTAQRFGDKDIFYPETQTDTDLLAMPISSGVEFFSQLRSVESPEELRFDLTLPSGADLRSDGEGGAVIARADQVLARVPAPTAGDAQGAEVPVQMRLDGNALILAVAHRSMDVAYPLLLDPIVDEAYGNLSWYAGYNLPALGNGSWSFASTDWGRFLYGTTPPNSTFEGSNRGLFISAKSIAETQWAYKSAEWRYIVPGSSTWIPAAGVSPLWRHNFENCPASKYPEPHDYVGLWSPAWSPQYGWMFMQNDASQAYKYSFAQPPTDWRKYTAQWFVIGLSTGAYNTSAIPCYRDLYAGGAYVWMDDMESPTLGKVTGAPSGWVSDESKFTISAPASDAGLGVQYATLFPEGTAYIENPSKQSQCTGLRANPCPASKEFKFELTGSFFDEGKKWAQLAVADPVGKVSGTAKWEMWVDRTPPEVTLSGQLAKVTEETGTDAQDPKKWDDLSLPVYNLTIKATDGSKKEGKTMRSGVKNIEIFRDGNKESVTWEPLPSCGETSCEMNKTFPLKLAGLASGKHTLKVIAVDFVGKKRERDIEFEYIPATGMKDEYVLHHFPLPDGQGNETEEEFPDRPELAVNVMNGNLVYRQKDVEVDGASADLEVERYYNSQLPTAENSEWGDGWTLAETPDLEPIDTGGSPAPDVAEVLDSSGAIEDGVQLPTEVGKTSFDPTLQATLTKETGGYAMTDETGSAAGEIVFDESGRTEELRTGEYAGVDYDYNEGGALEEIAIKDSATSSSEGLPAVKAPTYASAFGALGSGNGQLKAPGDVAVDASGNLWVVDKGNNRIEKFNAKGEYLTKFGTLGSGNGQFNRPTALAIDSKGNVWVADSDNNRIQEFSSGGTYLAKFGSAGAGNGQFAAPEGIAIDPEGNIWVSDTHNGRLQKFSAAGAFIKVISSKGSGASQLGEPKAIDATASGAVWVTDWQYNRVAEFGAGGEFMRQFGSAGTGNGQFEHPAAIDIGSEGSLWVADQGNNRIQRFDEAGVYLTKFGAKGSGSGQFSFSSPMGIAVENSGNVWVTDPANNRIQKWFQPPAVEEDDPSVELDVEGGLVHGLEGNEAGSHAYSYSGDDLTSYTGPLGKTTYKYDAAGRLTEVKLPNATYATIAYDTLGRVKSVLVAPGGTGAKTTTFEYKDEPRNTTVVPAGKPALYYDIGEDGSILKWWNTEKPPTIDDVAGSLWAERGEVHPEPINAGDKNLTIQAHSEEGLETIQVLANGSTLVDELTCKQTEAPGLECVTPSPKDEWITNTNSFAPGILNLEVIATDRNGLSSAKRFWVNIPVPPPPPPGGSLVSPTFAEVADFREEFGLDVWEPVEDELDLNDRIWNVLGAWHNPETPEGQVARASWEKWGMPMRNVDVAEMEYREQYGSQAASVIPQWVNEHALSSGYAGYYMNHKQGGLLYVGFTSNQKAVVNLLKQSGGLIAPDRIRAFPASPTNSLAVLETLQAAISEDTSPGGHLTRVGLDIAQNTVTVGTPEPTTVKNSLTAQFGINAPITVYEATGGAAPTGTYRERISGPVKAGDFIRSESPEIEECTTGFGAWESGGTSEAGEALFRHFILTAGHCFEQDALTFNWLLSPDGKQFIGKRDLGYVRRRSYRESGGGYVVDGEAIRAETPEYVPRSVYFSAEQSIRIDSPIALTDGMVVCFSGNTSNHVKCGKVLGPPDSFSYYGAGGNAPTMWQVPFKARVLPGDSGSPAWEAGSGHAVGLVTAADEPEFEGEIPPERGWLTPLLSSPGHPAAPGVLAAEGSAGGGILNLVQWKP